MGVMGAEGYFVYHTIRKDIIKYVYLKILRHHVLKAENWIPFF